MAAVHFILNEAQEEELAVLMQKEGITSRAGFFRFLMKFYKYHQLASTTQDAPPLSSYPSEITRVPRAVTPPDDSRLSPEKQRLLNDPRIFDEEVKQFIREMEE